MKRIVLGAFGLGVCLCVGALAEADDPNAADVAKQVEALKQERAQLLSALKRPKHIKRLQRYDAAADQLAAARKACLKLVDEAQEFYKDERGKVHGFALFKAARAKVDRLCRVRLKRLASSDRKRVRRLLQVDRALTQRDQRPRYDLRAYQLLLLGQGWTRTLRDYPRTKADAQRIRRDLIVERYNRVVMAKLPREDAELVRLTNGLRRGLGIRALMFNKALYQAARSHNEAMTKHRFFSHESPLPGQRTPEDRARRAGFEGALGENIAQASSARRAFESWLESPAMRAGTKVSGMPAQWPPLENGQPVRFYGDPSAPPLRTSKGVWVLQMGNLPGGRGGGGHLRNMLNNTWRDMGGAIAKGERSTGAYGDPASPFGSMPEAFEGKRVEDVFRGGGGGGGGGGSFGQSLPPLM